MLTTYSPFASNPGGGPSAVGDLRVVERAGLAKSLDGTSSSSSDDADAWRSVLVPPPLHWPSILPKHCILARRGWCAGGGHAWTLSSR
jgi:hypothetical protein